MPSQPNHQPYGQLIDRHHRIHTSLRVSLTDRCNLRCTYCMPAEGLPWLPREELLTDDEVVRLVRIAVGLGVDDVRFTGGEPTLRPSLVGIIAACAYLTPRPRLSLTTNGIGLAQLAAPLRDAGLDRVNVSLDTLNPTTFHAITRRHRLDDVLTGLKTARDVGLEPVKINALLLKGLNDQQAPDLLAFALDHGYQLRFIEQMPLDAQHAWQRNNMVTAEAIVESLRTRWRIEPDTRERGSRPAETFLVDGGPTTVGIIASVTRPFCADCNRVRLTADGQLRNCLFATIESDLRGPMRAGASDGDLATQIQDAVRPKALAHGIDKPAFVQPHRPMSAIGG